MTSSLEQNPASLFPDDVLTNCQIGKSWRVPHVNAAAGKEPWRMISSPQASAYLPMYLRRQTAKSRTRISYIPIFSGYLFFEAFRSIPMIRLSKQRLLKGCHICLFFHLAFPPPFYYLILLTDFDTPAICTEIRQIDVTIF